MNRRAVDPSQIIPGRPVDFQLGNQNATDRRTYKALLDLTANKVEGSPDLPNAVVGELLVFTATGWAPQDKRTYLSLDDLTDVSVSAPTTGHILRHNGSLFVNTPIGNLIALDDLSDVTISAVAGGDFLVYNDGTSQWGNKNWTPAAFGVGAAPTLAKLEVNTPDSGTRGFVVRGVTAQTADLFQARDVSDNLLVRIGPTGPLTLLDAVNVVLGATTGTKIGTATTQKLGFYNATPLAQQAQTVDLRTAIINLGLMASASGATPLSLNGGDLNANQALLSAGVRGNGGAISLGTSTVTVTDGADTTLSAGEMATGHLILSGALTAARNVIAPATTGGFYTVFNNTTGGFAVTVKTAAGTGIAIAAGKTALLRTGANVIRLTADV